MRKVLIIRFSSFGDIIQSLSAVNCLKEEGDDFQIHFLTKSEFASVVGVHPDIDIVWKYDKSSGILGLWSLARQLVRQHYDLYYDAHATMRTFLLRLMIRLLTPPTYLNWLKRSKNRWKRFLFFKLNKREVFELPFRGALSYVTPLQERLKIESFEFDRYVAWSFTKQMEAELFYRFLEKILPEQHFITIAPSAAWEMKRWPVEFWKQLVEKLPTFQFLILGGPQDHFCQEIAEVAPLRVINTAGQASLLESCCLVYLSEFVISADTGILHVADLFQVDGLALIGPTAFGHPSGSSMKVLETSHSCQPCTKDGRGKCSQSIYQRCMVEITPEWVVSEVESFFSRTPEPKQKRKRVIL